MKEGSKAMTNVDMMTSTAPTALVNDTRFDDLRKTIRNLGADVAKAEKAGQKAADSLPNVAQWIVRATVEGYLDLDADKTQTTILHRDYMSGRGKASATKGSEKGQVAKVNAFYHLGRQKLFNGESAMDLIVRLFVHMNAAKDKPRSKFEAYLEAAKCINNAATENPPRVPRLPAIFTVDEKNNDQPRDDWKPNELTDDQIKDSMRKPQNTKAAKKVVEMVHRHLKNLTEGTKPYADIQCNDQALIDAKVILEKWIATITIRDEQNELFAMAKKLNVSIAQMNAALTPAPRAGRKRTQRKG
jgi:hypothetical protein